MGWRVVTVRVPRYQELARVLTARIRAGDYPVGCTLPTEQELCAAFGASRHTVRDALRILSDTGLVHRRQGMGSRVIGAGPPPGFVQDVGSLRDLTSYAAGERFAFHRCAMVVPDAAETALLGPAPGGRWLFVEGLRLAPEGHPVAHAQAYIHADFADLEPVLPTLTTPYNERIEASYGRAVDEVIQEIAAAPFPASSAAALGRAPGTLAIRVMRRYLEAGGTPLLIGVNWVPPETFQFAMRIRRADRS